MIDTTQHTFLYAYKEWAEAYVDLQDDERLVWYFIELDRNEAGRQLLERSRQLWREQGFPMAPFDEMLNQRASWVMWGRKKILCLNKTIHFGFQNYYWPRS